MIFTTTPIGAVVIEPERLADARGFFARAFCAREFETRGLNPHVAQCNISFNARRGTLRGMHFQHAPYTEAKLVRCTAGAVHAVALDIRPGSPSFRRHFAIELSAENRKMLYVPEGVAHGFQTLVDGAEVFYQISTPHAPGHEGGVRWNDPAFGIEWPLPVTTIAERDAGYPDFQAT